MQGMVFGGGIFLINFCHTQPKLYLQKGLNEGNLISLYFCSITS